MSGRTILLGGTLALLAYVEASGILGAFGFSSWIARATLYVAVSGIALAMTIMLFDYNEWRGGGVTGLLSNKDQLLAKDQVQSHFDTYEGMFGGERRADDALLEKRKANYTTMVNNFYDLVTDFYEYGWGDSFHFAARLKTETFMESLRRSEYYLAHRLEVGPGKLVADFGCGVGGPMRAIAVFSGANILGINNNDYQIKVARKHNENIGLDKQCDFLKCDFMHVPREDNSLDAAYAIEALCHSPDRATMFKEIFRLLKPGGIFATYDWMMTSKYDESKPRHKELREAIEWGNSLPRLSTIEETKENLKKAGFVLEQVFDTIADTHSPYQISWYAPLEGELTLRGFRHHPIGRNLTNIMCATLEFLRIAPKGTTKVAKLLHKTAEDLVESGRLEIFSPDVLFVCRKPLMK